MKSKKKDGENKEYVRNTKKRETEKRKKVREIQRRIVPYQRYWHLLHVAGVV